MLARDKIMHEFAKWTAFKSKRGTDAPGKEPEIFPALDSVDWCTVLQESRGPITSAEFNCWHKSEAESLAKRVIETVSKRLPQPQFSIGWAAKLINVYLKTRCYVGNDGREGIRDVMHPPIDNILVKQLKKEAVCLLHTETIERPPEIASKLYIVLEPLGNFGTIRNIETYEQYHKIIQACGVIAYFKKFPLFELERFWSATDLEGVS